MKINLNVEMITESPIRKIATYIAAAQNTKNIISFGGGAPSLPPPEAVIKALKDALTNSPQKAVAYSATRGNKDVIEAIVDDLKTYNVNVSHNEVLLTDGATEGIWLAIVSIVEKGSEILALDPTYVGYESPIRLAYGTMNKVHTTLENNFQPDLEDIKESITDKTKAIILLSPDNPTGRIIKKDVLKGIVDIAEDKDLWIIYDETYKDIYYEDSYVPIVNIGTAAERTICTFTLSKSASIPGLRIGYSYGPKKLIDNMEKVKQFLTLCPSTLGQIAIKAFYNNNIKRRYLDEIVLPTYSRRREAMGKYLKEIFDNVKFIKPQGGFFYFVDFSHILSDLGIDEEIFATQVFDTMSTVIIPGKFFGSSGKNYFRFTFVSENEERIKEGLERIKKFIHKKKQLAIEGVLPKDLLH